MSHIFHIGIDVASEKHDCCILDQNGSPVSQFSFGNNRSGFDALLLRLRSLGVPSGTKIGLEATGIYSQNLTSFLRRMDYEVITFNPLSVKQQIKAATLRKTKTDKADARFIANLMMRGDFSPDPTPSYHISELKSLSRARFHAVKSRTAAKLRINRLVTVLFPELIRAFSSLFITSVLTLLEKYPSATKIASARVDTLSRLLSSSSHGRFGRDKAVEIKTLAKSSIGSESIAAEIELSFAIAELRLLNEHVKAYEEQIDAIMNQIDSPITSIPGIGNVLGAVILSEIGDIHRFSSPAKLLAYAGLDPSIYQSGKFTPASGSMVKRGSSYLRWALIRAAESVARCSSLFAAFLQKKLSEGKHYCVAIPHVAKKLVRVSFAILSKSLPFSDSFAA